MNDGEANASAALNRNVDGSAATALEANVEDSENIANEQFGGNNVPEAVNARAAAENSSLAGQSNESNRYVLCDKIIRLQR